MLTDRDGRTHVNRTTRRRGIAVVLALLLLPAGTVTAQDASPGYTVRTEPVDLDRLPSVDISDGAVELTLWEALGIALRRNYGLIIERYNLEESTFRLTENLGIYDLGVTADLSGFDETSPAVSNLDGADVQQQEQARLDLGLSQLVPTGGTVEFGFNNRRFETNSQFAAVNPSFTVDTDLSYRQPLLRDFGRLPTERNVMVARNNIGASKETFEVQVAGVIRTVAQNYWNLVEAREQLGVAEESLRLAEELHEQNKIRVEVGTLAPLELIQSEAGVATRTDELIRAQIGVGNAEDDLRQVLNIPEGELWEVRIVPRTPPDITRIEVDTAEAVAHALEERPELARKRIQNENLVIDLRLAKNRVRPRLDFAATYGFNGLGGDATLRDFLTGEIISEAPGDYSDALAQVEDGEFDGWSYAVNFSIPIQNREAKARRAVAEIAVERAEAELSQLELQVSTEVRKAARAVVTAEALVDSTRVSRRLEEENLRAEQKRYENGMSTSFQVLQIQEDLAEARSNAVQAEAGYRKALIDFYRATGTLTEAAGVQIDSE